jgi:hypothetical protein
LQFLVCHRTSDRGHAARLAVGVSQRIDHRSVVRAVASRLNDHVFVKAQMKFS